MLFCRVTLGKSFLQFSAMKMAHAPPGHHSVIGRPSVNGLAYAEYVIYRGEQVRELRYLTTAKTNIFSGSRYLVHFQLCVFAGLPRVPHHIPDHQARQHTFIPDSSGAEVLVHAGGPAKRSDCSPNNSHTSTDASSHDRNIHSPINLSAASLICG